MNYVDVFYQSDDGLRLYARDYPGPDRTAPAILCLPGLTRNSKDFAPLAEKLRTTHRVICPDLRGRGRSDRDTDASRYRPDRYVADMRTLLDVLGISEVILIGTSLGGLMSMIMLATDAGRIRAAVINDIGPEVDPHGLERIAGYVGKTAPAVDWDAAAEQVAHTNGAAFPDYHIEDWRAMARELYVQVGTTPVLDYDPAIALGISNSTAAPILWPLFEQAGVKPMLVIRGAISDILSAETLAEMKRRLPHIVVQNVARRGHAPTLSEPEAWSAIRKFLDGLGMTSATSRKG
jgi:pimeloyl-ACP methyl ester carboxylesterase